MEAETLITASADQAEISEAQIFSTSGKASRGAPEEPCPRLAVFSPGPAGPVDIGHAGRDHSCLAAFSMWPDVPLQ